MVNLLENPTVLLVGRILRDPQRALPITTQIKRDYAPNSRELSKSAWNHRQDFTPSQSAELDLHDHTTIIATG